MNALEGVSDVKSECCSLWIRKRTLKRQIFCLAESLSLLALGSLSTYYNITNTRTRFYKLFTFSQGCELKTTNFRQRNMRQ